MRGSPWEIKLLLISLNSKQENDTFYIAHNFFLMLRSQIDPKSWGHHAHIQQRRERPQVPHLPLVGRTRIRRRRLRERTWWKVKSKGRVENDLKVQYHPQLALDHFHPSEEEGKAEAACAVGEQAMGDRWPTARLCKYMDHLQEGKINNENKENNKWTVVGVAAHFGGR